MNMRIELVAALFWVATGAVFGQRQIDFREQTNVRVEHRFTQDFSMAIMAAGILTNDFNELGFCYIDGGLGYKITPRLGINANYRLLYRRNLRNAYDQRQVLYADLDYSKRLLGPFTFTSTLRLQGQFFNHLFTESARKPLFYTRARAGLRYKVNYYWQPFLESELFVPVFDLKNSFPDQIRVGLGFAYTFNRYARVEIYEQLQQQLNTAAGNIFFLTAINWGFRF